MARSPFQRGPFDRRWKRTATPARRPCRHCGLTTEAGDHPTAADCLAAVLAEDERRRAAFSVDGPEWAEEDPPRV